MMALVISPEHLDRAPGTLSGHAFRRADNSVERLLGDRNIARSYAGGSYQRGYQDFDPQQPSVVLDEAYSAAAQGIGCPSADQAKFFVKSGGADTPRPFTLARDSAGPP